MEDIAGILENRTTVFFNQQKPVRVHINLCSFSRYLFLTYFPNTAENLVFYAFLSIGIDVAIDNDAVDIEVLRHIGTGKGIIAKNLEKEA